MCIATGSSEHSSFVFWSFVLMLARRYATQCSRTKSGHLEKLPAVSRREPDEMLTGSTA